MQDSIPQRVDQIRTAMARAAERSGRHPDEITLMAVTKFHPVDAVRSAMDAGVRCFGENRVQEAIRKYEGIVDRVDLHLIGHLQRNKARTAAAFFSCVESIDRIETALALEKALDEADHPLDILVEVNTSGEATKSGVHGRDSLFSLIDGLLELPHLRLRGLMTMAPFTQDEQPIRASFQLLQKLFLSAKEGYPTLDFDILSMGMSNDYQIAIEEGSTMVRVGTAIFGERTT